MKGKSIRLRLRERPIHADRAPMACAPFFYLPNDGGSATRSMRFRFRAILLWFSRVCLALRKRKSCATHGIIRDEGRDFSMDYFGGDSRRAGPNFRSECESLFSRQTRGGFSNPEVGIDSKVFADVVRRRLSSEEKICCRLQSVRSVQLANRHATVF
jgi:hypothetical protein